MCYRLCLKGGFKQKIDFKSPRRLLGMVLHHISWKLWLIWLWKMIFPNETMTLVSPLDVPALCIVIIIHKAPMVTYQVGTLLPLLNSVLCGEIRAPLILWKYTFFSYMYHSYSHTIMSSFLSLIFSGSTMLLPTVHLFRTCGCLKTPLVTGLAFHFVDCSSERGGNMRAIQRWFNVWKCISVNHCNVRSKKKIVWLAQEV